MAHRSIEEQFRAIRPKGFSGIPSAPTIGVGVSSDNGDLSGSLSQAAQQISQLQATYQQQAALISANTEAIQGNTSAQGSRSGGSTAAGVASSVFGGFGLMSPLISGIASLFGGSSQPAPLPVYMPPPPVAINATLQAATPTTPSTTSTAPSTTQTVSGSSQAAPAPQITVNVSAMDSQSFMDRSADIASAVRQAMLNLHPINDVVASL